MTHGWSRLEATFRIPDKAFRDEIHERLIVTTKDLGESLGSRLASTTL